MTVTEQDIERAREYWDRNAPFYSPSDALAAYAAHVTAEKDAEIARLRGALQFYASGFRLFPHRSKHGMDLSEWKPTEGLLEDCGNVALAALNKEIGESDVKSRGPDH